jgi:hypothetical protein
VFATIFEQNGFEVMARVLGAELLASVRVSAGQATPPCWTDLSKTIVIWYQGSTTTDGRHQLHPRVRSILVPLASRLSAGFIMDAQMEANRQLAERIVTDRECDLNIVFNSGLDRSLVAVSWCLCPRHCMGMTL